MVQPPKERQTVEGTIPVPILPGGHADQGLVVNEAVDPSMKPVSISGVGLTIDQQVVKAMDAEDHRRPPPRDQVVEVRMIAEDASLPIHPRINGDVNTNNQNLFHVGQNSYRAEGEETNEEKKHPSVEKANKDAAGIVSKESYISGRVDAPNWIKGSRSADEGEVIGSHEGGGGLDDDNKGRPSSGSPREVATLRRANRMIHQKVDDNARKAKERGRRSSTRTSKNDEKMDTEAKHYEESNSSRGDDDVDISPKGSVKNANEQPKKPTRKRKTSDRSSSHPLRSNAESTMSSIVIDLIKDELDQGESELIVVQEGEMAQTTKTLPAIARRPKKTKTSLDTNNEGSTLITSESRTTPRESRNKVDTPTGGSGGSRSNSRLSSLRKAIDISSKGLEKVAPNSRCQKRITERLSRTTKVGPSLSPYVYLEDPNKYYVEEEAYIYHDPPFPTNTSDGVLAKDLRPIPPPPPIPNLPDSGFCQWTFDENSRVMTAEFKRRSPTEPLSIDPVDSKFFFEMLERDDITMISRGFLNHSRMDASLWNLDNIAQVLRGEFYHKFRRFDRIVDEQGFETFSEKDRLYSMRFADYARYYDQRMTYTKAEGLGTSHSGEATFTFLDHMNEEHSINVRTTALYMIDVDIKRLMPLLFQNFVDSFEMQAVLPGGSHCMMNSVRRFSCDALFIFLTLPAASSDILLLAIPGYRLPPMLALLWVRIFMSRRLHPSPIFTKMDTELLTLVTCASVDTMRSSFCGDCLNVTRKMLSGSSQASQRKHPGQTHEFSMDCTQSHMATGLAKSRGGPVPKGLKHAREWGVYFVFLFFVDIFPCFFCPTYRSFLRFRYCPSVCILKPGDLIHINKGRLHAFRKMSTSKLREEDCHAQQRLRLIAEENIDGEEMCISVAWDWMYRGVSAAGINREMLTILEASILNRKNGVTSLAVPELSLLQMAKTAASNPPNPRLSFVSRLSLPETAKQQRLYDASKREICKGILPCLCHMVDDHLGSLATAAKASTGAASEAGVLKPGDTTKYKRGRRLSLAERTDCQENPMTCPLDPYGDSDFACKLCRKELSNVYYHCDGCELLLSKDFNICKECYTEKKYMVVVPMHPSNRNKHATLNHTGEHHSRSQFQTIVLLSLTLGCVCGCCNSR